MFARIVSLYVCINWRYLNHGFLSCITYSMKGLNGMLFSCSTGLFNSSYVPVGKIGTGTLGYLVVGMCGVTGDV